VKHRTTTAITLIAVSALAALTGCGGSSGSSSGTAAAASGGAVRGGDLTIARTADSQSMNNTTVFDNESIWIFEQIFQTLYTVTPNGKGVQPMLATGYTVSADKKTYTFTLRPGVKFSTGQPMTSADVKFSIDQASAAEKGWGYINTAIKSVAAPTPSTVVVTLKYPWAPLLADLSLFSNGIVPANYGGKSETAFYNAPVGTGPFKWDFWHKGSALKLVRNPNYWEKGKPYLNSVTWTDVPSDNTRELQLKGGQAQIDEFPAWSTVGQPEVHAGRHDEPVQLDQDRLPGHQRAAQAVPGRARAPGDLAGRQPGRAGQGGAVRQRQAGQLAVPAAGALLPGGHPGPPVRPDRGQAGDGQVQRAERLLHHDPGVLGLLRLA
jgi:peptide/nickel transport system substrate-binding protein